MGRSLFEQITIKSSEAIGSRATLPTCSIGFAANRHLAKIAGSTQKPDGLSIWRPEDMPKPLVKLPLEDIPGIGKRMEEQLNKAGIKTTEALLATQPKQLRAIWRNVTGERLWYALHGRLCTCLDQKAVLHNGL